MTDQTASSEDRIAQRAARSRRLAERVIAAAATRGGFVVVSGAPLSGRRLLLQAIAGAAAAEFQVIEIAGSGGPRAATPTGAASAGGAAAKPPLFVIDDAAQPSSAGLRDICETAPLSPEWAAMLSVRAVLITRFAIAELQFLAPRIIACVAFSEEGSETSDPATPEPAAMPARAGDGGRPETSRPPAAVLPKRRHTAPPAANRIVAPQPRPAAGRRSGGDLRLYALLAYLAIVGGLGGCYLALQNRQIEQPPSAGLTGPATGTAAAAGPAVGK